MVRLRRATAAEREHPPPRLAGEVGAGPTQRRLANTGGSSDEQHGRSPFVEEGGQPFPLGVASDHRGAHPASVAHRR
jgi:hypothetical protein